MLQVETAQAAQNTEGATTLLSSAPERTPLLFVGVLDSLPKTQLDRLAALGLRPESECECLLSLSSQTFILQSGAAHIALDRLFCDHILVKPATQRDKGRS